jgi:hypothetical protein
MDVGFDKAMSQRPSKQAPTSLPSAAARPLVGESEGEGEDGEAADEDGCSVSAGVPVPLALDGVLVDDGSAPSAEPSSWPPLPPQPVRTTISASATAPPPARPLSVLIGQPLNS